MTIDTRETESLKSENELCLRVKEPLRVKAKEPSQPRTKKSMQRLARELEVYQLEMEVQNTELRRTQVELENQQVELELQNNELMQIQEELELSRNTYSELYDFAPVGYCTFDARGVIKNINLTGANMLGLERQQLINRPFPTFITDAGGREIFTCHLETVLQRQGMQRCEISLSGKEGVVIYGQLQSVAVDSIENREGMILTSIVDGTVARQLGMEIQEAREYAENIVETVLKPLVVLDSELKILTANHSFYETFRVTPEETIGNFIYAVGNRQWDIPGLRILFEEILPHHTAFNDYEVEHDFPGIGRKNILLNAREIFRKKIGSHIILLAMEDITAHKEADAERKRLVQILLDKNAEVEAARFAAEKANLAKSDFLSSMSHELRTPLGAILGFGQLLESSVPSPTPAQKRSVDQILKAGWYLLELINEILDLALIESGKLPLSLEAVALADVLLECEVMIEPYAQLREISVTFTPLETSWFVSVDRTRVKQLLLNLLTNAIKYNRKDGSVAVTCSLHQPDVIRISVMDTGEGLAPELLAQLFQPFNRLGQEAKATEGTGIGLVVSKRLVELMGGIIGVESTVGEGSVFWIELNRVDESLAGAHPVEGETNPEPKAEGDGLLQTVLYIEDNPANLMLVEEIIARRTNIRLLSAVDGISGVEIAHNSLPDVILMDINLPGISGIDAMKILAKDPATAHIPIVAISANAIPQDIVKGLEAGFFRYLTKPIKVNEFLDTLDLTLNYAKMNAATAVKKEQT